MIFRSRGRDISPGFEKNGKSDPQKK